MHGHILTSALQTDARTQTHLSTSEQSSWSPSTGLRGEGEGEELGSACRKEVKGRGAVSVGGE
jgi:hypothetical protein